MKKSKKHIVLITPGFPSNEMDTSCIPALQIFCKALIKNEELKLSVITLHYPFTTKSYAWNSIDVHPLGFQNRPSIPLISGRKVKNRIRDIHSKDPVDLLHSFWLGECSLAGYQFSRKNSIDHIITLMGQDARKGNRYARLLPVKEMNIISLSKFQQDLFYENYRAESTLIPWGVDSKSISPSAEKTIDVIGIGSLIPLKDYSAFIKIIHKLKVDFPDIKSEIIGEGKMRSKLEKQILALGLENNLTLLGSLSYEETQNRLAKSKVLLHTSQYESFGMVFAEALANNTYIVSRRTGFAKMSDHWHTGDTEDDFIFGCKKFLDSDKRHNADYPDIERTVQDYINHFYLKSDEGQN
jgi:glycosyltransferase involved in cell wall biosynthesis